MCIRDRDLFVILSHVIIDAFFDSVCRVEQMADRHIMIQCIDDQSNIFTQVAAEIVVSCEKFRILINKVCSKQFIKGSFCVCCVEFFHSLCEELSLIHI